MGQLVWPPYEDFRDKTEAWQQFEKQLRWQTKYQTVLLPLVILLFAVALGLWILAFGDS